MASLMKDYCTYVIYLDKRCLSILYWLSLQELIQRKPIIFEKKNFLQKNK